MSDDEHTNSTRNLSRRSWRMESQSGKKKTPTITADLAGVIDLDTSSEKPKILQTAITTRLKGERTQKNSMDPLTLTRFSRSAMCAQTR